MDKTSINVKVAVVVILISFILGYAGGYLGRDVTNEMDNFNWCVREIENSNCICSGISKEYPEVIGGLLEAYTTTTTTI